MRNDKDSQENDAIARWFLGPDRGPLPDDECSNYERDKTRYCSPPVVKQDARAYAHEKHEQNRKPPAQRPQRLAMRETSHSAAEHWYVMALPSNENSTSQICN